MQRSLARLASRRILDPLIFSAVLAIPMHLAAQGSDDEVVELSPFQVDASGDVGYRATNSVAGTSLNTAIKDIPMAIEVITEQFI